MSAPRTDIVAGTPSAATPSPVAGDLGDAEFELLRALVAERAAIVLEDGKEYLVRSRLQPLVRDLGLGSIGDLVRELLLDAHGELADQVVDAMTTNETSFFRDVHPFDALAESIVPELLDRRHPGAPLTVWCGASSSGQEPYSVAMTLLERCPQLDPSRIRIVATDLSPTMVQRCRDATYTQLEVDRGLPAELRDRYFEQVGTHWRARPELRRLVEVHRVNLTGAWPPVPRCDLVMLRNVLIYFSNETKREVLGRIRREVLAADGYLVLGTSETTLNLDATYVRRSFGRAACYQIGGAPTDLPNRPGVEPGTVPPIRST